MRKNKILKTIILVIPVLLAGGCLKDNPNPVNSYVTSDAIEMLMYLESNGDIINSTATISAFVNPQDLFLNLSSYVILDIRDAQLFADGHINGAITIQSPDLLSKIKSIDTSKVILVSQNGQSASYYGGLLRLDGLSNVYILKFGMAGWNDHFAGDWKNSSGNQPTGYQFFNNVAYFRGPYASLPNVKLNSSGDIKERIEARIEELLSEKFDDGVIYNDTSSLTAWSEDVFNSDLYYSSSDSSFDDQYIVCYGDNNLYYTSKGPLISPSHPPKSILYNAFHDLKSIYYLQTIPANKKVVIYSSSGHLSAFATSYLRLLGYTNVRSLLFGAVWINPFPGAMNYPYVN
jgi:rhodanese-related sulfurtransferase